MDIDSSVKAAGCLFIQGKAALCGYSQKYKFFSGLGGKVEAGERPVFAAWRETLEELFDISPPPLLILDCIEEFIYNKEHKIEGYYFKILSFDDYQKLYQVLKKHNITSPLYAKGLPTSFIDLVLERKPTENVEVTELLVTDYHYPSQKVDPEWQNDCFSAEKIMKTL
jgi:hypothetical protein